MVCGILFLLKFAHGAIVWVCLGVVQIKTKMLVGFVWDLNRVLVEPVVKDVVAEES